jgi:5-methylcytosine-specific restriction endonuclease McrA
MSTRSTYEQPADNGSSVHDVPSETRRCATCRVEKPFAEFNRERKGPGGLNRRCKQCFNEYYRAYRAAHRDRVNEIGAEYHERLKVKNPARLDAKRRRRRERERAAGTLSAAEKRAIWDAYDGRCYLCHNDAEQYDHVQPLAAGGRSTIDNVRPICAGCNARKGDDWPIDFDELRARIYAEYRREEETAERGSSDGPHESLSAGRFAATSPRQTGAPVTRGA